MLSLNKYASLFVIIIVVISLFSFCKKKNVNVSALTLSTTTSIANSATTATSGGNITSDGGASVTARGVCWSTSANPTIADLKTSDGTGTGSFTSNITGLTASTTYHVRAYATNSAGTGYGEDVVFTTPVVIVLPTLTTSTSTATSISTALSGGSIASDGGASITGRGVCWSSGVNPTISDSKTTDGTGKGVFTSIITGLNVGTTYHVIAYATNSVGTAYGQDMTFTTPLTQTETFTNPIINGADPWIIGKDGYYYYSHTLGNRVEIWKTNAVSKLGTITSKKIFTPVSGLPNSSNIWAPEIHFLDNKWYVYYTAGSGPDITQRTWVLENSNADPTTGTWVDKGRIFASDADFWAIDGSVLEYNGSKYFLWSGRPNPAVQNQNIYIAKMTNPWTLQTPAVMLTKPQLSWEINGPVNEGPEILKNNSGKIFLVYSASGCWTDDYALGMLTLRDGGDPLILSDWTKSQQPVFIKKTVNMAYAPGHASFFKSPDGTEDWIIYHANNNSGDGCADKRNVRIQKFNWNTDGTPNFGEPLKIGTSINVPSGE